MARVIHFEIGTDDLDRAIKFYKIFGWEITDAGMPDGQYFLAKTGLETAIGIDGALMPRSYAPEPIRITISVDNLSETIEKVKSAGGKVEGKIGSIPGVGQYVNIRDTEGNQIGLLEPAE